MYDNENKNNQISDKGQQDSINREPGQPEPTVNWTIPEAGGTRERAGSPYSSGGFPEAAQREQKFTQFGNSDGGAGNYGRQENFQGNLNQGGMNRSGSGIPGGRAPKQGKNSLVKKAAGITAAAFCLEPSPAGL